MPRGQPDFGMYQQKEVGATLADMADLAVRLGSIVEFDRRGDVICVDDFESPVLKWLITGAPAGYSGVLSNDAPKSGAQCLKLTTNNTDEATAVASRQLQYRGSMKLGAEISFANPSAESFIIMSLQAYTGTKLLYGAIKFDRTLEKLYYLDSTPVYVELASGIKILALNQTHYTMKFVIDTEAEKYIRFLFGITEYDLSAYSLYSEATTVAPRLIYGLDIDTKEAAAKTVYYDNFVATINEP